MIGKVIAGRYRLESRLGEGGMGVVYRARHVLIDRVVALKVIRPDLRSERHLREWMVREARAANRVDHAHIVQIHDIGETDDGSLFLVMEYLTGVSLASQIAKGPMPVPRAVDILEQMCAALARAHDLGVVHRDLKADNIMLTVRAGRPDFVKILDFGLAALAHAPRLAPKGAVFGTPEYMSPEQARGEDATPLSDLYALGVLFFEMLTGKLPFRSRDRDELLRMQREQPPPKPSSLREGVPEHADRIVLRLLEKDPARRFRDAHHLAEELKALQRSLPQTAWDAHVADAPVPAPPPPPPAHSPGVGEWTERAALLTRAVARAFPSGRTPEDVARAVQQLWEVASRAARLEGELAIHQKRLEAIERRGRALRADVGRKVEDLSEEQSRLLREAAEERERIRRLSQVLQRAQATHREARRRFDELPPSETDPDRFRRAALRLADAEAEARAIERLIADHERRAAARERVAADLREQVRQLRNQLSRYSEALEKDLQAGREHIARRVREALEYERTFDGSQALLLRRLRGRPECRELLDELTTGSNRAQAAEPVESGERAAAGAR